MLLSASLFLGTSCGLSEDILLDQPFFHIMENNTSTSIVNESATLTATYNVYFSAKRQTESVDLVYEIIVGDGLKEGVDFELVNKSSRTITFLPGIYDMPIRIKWKPRPIDPTKDNTLKIRLVSNSKGYNLGLPGPSGNQREFIITKTK